MKKTLFVLLLFVAACVPATPTATPQVISVYATPAAQPWLARLYDCGARQPAVVRLTDSGAEADIVLRLGAPSTLANPAFQIDSEDVLVVANPAHAATSLNAEQVRGIFGGQINDWGAIDPASPGKVQVWVFAPGQDVQQVFSDTLAGAPIVSSARLATSPQEMAAGIAADPNAIGILPRHALTQQVAAVFTVASAPLLAITPVEPVGAVKGLLACLQG